MYHALLCSSLIYKNLNICCQESQNFYELEKQLLTQASLQTIELARDKCHFRLTHNLCLQNTNTLSKNSIILDASKYIEDLKHKIERLNREIAYARGNKLAPMVTVETLDKGFLINVFSGKSFPGLLVSILEAFEELGLNVLEASASCSEPFRLEAVGGEVKNI
ncbi:hypothetical protein AXF42_Ash004731 [Apostasia shenzhenica]|uniref:Plant bHLH transcription factor ACT-like domain-containing protein n=1 Tax=Apostasia shenzhenica TaxID=1088818 RepID=A0A2I0BHH4_9ASPA|nr:hypothetical protein AXF42_Ash004731 [Apostasia shenzhenica]